VELLVKSFQLLRKQRNLAVLGGAGLVERVSQVLNLFVLLALDLLGLLLLEQNLVFVVDLSLSQALVSLLSDLVKSLIEPDFF